MTRVCPLMSIMYCSGQGRDRLLKQPCLESECALWSNALRGCSLNNGVVNLVRPNPIETYRT